MFSQGAEHYRLPRVDTEQDSQSVINNGQRPHVSLYAQQNFVSTKIASQGEGAAAPCMGRRYGIRPDLRIAVARGP